MHEHSAEMLRCLRETDVPSARRLWHHLAPRAPAPKTDYEALVVIHYARTLCARLSVRMRAYSHRWLLYCGMPSGLPDEMRSKAERMYPRIADSYGVAVHSSFPEVKTCIREAMIEGVLDCYASNRREPEYVVPVMMERRAQARKRLHGILGEAAARDLRKRTLNSLRGKHDG